jgi:hypothetical protein
MVTKLLAASVLTIGLATSAMAQSSDSNRQDWLHNNWLFGNEASSSVDSTTTGSINGDSSGLNTLGNPGPVGPCASSTPGPDANADGNVNDHYCGK